MHPIEFKEQTLIIAKDQPQYRRLPAHVDRKDSSVPVTSCWKLTIKERIKLLFTGKLWLQQLTFGQSLQPQLPSLEKTFK